jgi:hypothetical protein
MALLGKLAVAVVADVGQLKAGMAEARGEIGKLDKEVKKSGLGLQQISKYATIAGAAIVTAMGTMLVATAKSAEEIDLLAKRTGVTREALQGLAYAAKQEGTSIQALGTGLARLSRYMMDTRDGTGEARLAFEEMGIAVTDANGELRSSSEVLMEIADQMHGATNETEMQALAMKTLGRSGADMIPFLRMGSEEIRRLMDEARQLGYVLDEQAIIELEAFGDNIEALKTGLAGFGRQIAGDIVPYANSFLSALIDIQKVFHALPDPIRKVITVGGLLAGTLLLVGGALSSLVIKIAATKAAMLALGASFAPFLVGGAVVVGLGLVAGLISEIRNRTKALKGDLEGLSETQLEDMLKTWEARRKKAIDELAKVEREVGKKYKKGSDMIGPIFVGGILEEMELSEQAIANIRKQLSLLRKEQPKTGSEWSSAEEIKKAREALAALDLEMSTFGDVQDLAGKKAAILRDLILDLKAHGIDPTKTSMGNLVAQYQQFAAASDSAKEATDRLKASTDLLARAKQEQESWNNRKLSSLEVLAAQLEAQALLDDKNRIALLAAASTMRALYYEQQTATDQEKRTADAKQNNLTATQLLTEAQQRLAEMTGNAIPEWKTFADSLRRAAAADGVIPETAKALRDLADQIEQLGAKAPEAETWEDALATQIKNMRDWRQDMIDITTSTAQAMNGTFEDFFFDGFTGKLKTLADYVTSFAQSVARAISAALAGQLAGAIVGGMFPGLPAYASGGPVTAGQLAVVGERGPELFIPGSNGRILSHEDSMRAVGGDVQVNLINQTGIPMAARQAGPSRMDGARMVTSLILEAKEKNVAGIGEVK